MPWPPPDASPPRYAIDLAGVVAAVDGFPVLTGVDLRVAGGEVVLVTGPNGAGKTSLLRVLAGMLRVADGSAQVLGFDLVRDRRSHRRHVALVGQETGCYDDLTVRRNLKLHARMSGATEARTGEVLESLGLDSVADVAHGRLSTGQRRRCALAVGLVRDVDLLLLDEPHAGLDADARDIVDGVILAAQAAGKTVLLASHELDRARLIAGREVVLTRGFISNTKNP